MKAVVLVGGEGTRLRPLTFTTPKPLLPIAGTPFLERQLRWLVSHGVEEVVLSLGYLPDAFVKHFPDGTFEGLRLHYAVEDEPLGTAGAIRFAAEFAAISDRVIVCNGDVLTTLDLSAFVKFHLDRGAAASIHLIEVEDPSAFGVVPTYPDGKVKAFVEKPPKGTAPTNLINAGTYVLEPSVLERIPSQLSVSIEHETFPRLVEQEGTVYALASDDYWIDIGTPEKYIAAHIDVNGGALGERPTPAAQESDASVWIESGAQVAADAVLEGPSLIMRGATVESGAHVVASTLGAGATVGDGAALERAVLLDGASVAPGAHVRESIIGPDACVEQDAKVTDYSIVGAGARVQSGSTLAAGRVPVVAATG